MSVKVSITYDCGGCEAVEQIDPIYLLRSFHGVTGRPYGFGVWKTDNAPDFEALAPEGWMAFDPYTQCTYCPACVANIFDEKDEAAA